jgi:hypothetical protein
MQAIPLLGNFTIHCSGGGFYEGALSVTMRLRNSPTGQGIGTAFPGTQTQPTALNFGETLHVLACVGGYAGDFLTSKHKPKTFLASKIKNAPYIVPCAHGENCFL